MGGHRWGLRVVPALALVVAGCSGGGSSSDAGSDGATSSSGTPETTETTGPPERFAGPVDEFYAAPDPLPPGEPGQLIRVQEVATDGEATTVRVMYHSRDAEDRDRAVTGIVTYPTAPPPDDGWPVVSWSHGTTGLVSQCAPSRNGGAAPAFGVAGVAVATDYVGLGPVGEIHPYLSKPSEGNAAIDAVRAARNLADAHAGGRWLSIGFSQGGHGALSAAELAADYAPELDLVGTVSIAPGSDFDRTFGGVDDIVARVTGAMALYGAVGEHPDLDPTYYAGPELEAAADVIEAECLDAIVPALLGVPAETFYERDPRETEPARSLLLANEVGDVRVDAPLLLVAGTDDQTVVIDRVRSLFARLCDAGQVTELVVVDGATHDDIVPRSSSQVEAWLADRLADEPPPPANTCTAPPDG